MSKKKIPETSLAAYQSITNEQKENHYNKILATLAELKTASAEQIASHTTITYWQVGKRMSELEKKQLVYNTGLKVATRTGRSAYTYALCNPGSVPPKTTEKAMPGESVADFSKKILQQKLF